MADEEREERGVGDPRWSKNAMLGFLLGDVSWDTYKRKFMNVLIGFGRYLFQEIDSELKIDWARKEPLKTRWVMGKERRPDGTVRKKKRAWDDNLDSEKLKEERSDWKYNKEQYFKKRPHLFVFMLQSVNLSVDIELSAHPTYSKIRREDDTLALWMLFQEVTRGIAMNNSSLLKQYWESLRYIAGNNIVTFWVEYDSAWEQCDHAATSEESKIPDSTKAWQLTKAFGEANRRGLSFVCDSTRANHQLHQEYDHPGFARRRR
jgi:hypothetical protein